MKHPIFHFQFFIECLHNTRLCTFISSKRHSTSLIQLSCISNTLVFHQIRTSQRAFDRIQPWHYLLILLMNLNTECAEIKMNSVEPKIYEIVKKAVNGDIENFEISVQDPNKKGEGYLGQIFFICLKDKRNGKHLNYVVKQAFSDKTIRDFTPIRNIFLNEIYFYTTAWPKLLKFQGGIPKTYHFNHIAKCFATIPEENFERLVLENLKLQGFVMHDKKKALEKEKFEFIFKLYGKFHSASLAYKALHPEEFSEMTKSFHDIFAKFFDNKAFADVNKYTHVQCLESLQPGVDDAVIEKYKHYVDDGVKLFKDTLVNGKYTALIHGDCWSNNMMFKYDVSLISLQCGHAIDLAINLLGYIGRLKCVLFTNFSQGF